MSKSWFLSLALFLSYILFCQDDCLLHLPNELSVFYTVRALRSGTDGQLRLACKQISFMYLFGNAFVWHLIQSFFFTVSYAGQNCNGFRTSNHDNTSIPVYLRNTNFPQGFLFFKEFKARLYTSYSSSSTLPLIKYLNKDFVSFTKGILSQTSSIQIISSLIV